MGEDAFHRRLQKHMETMFESKQAAVIVPAAGEPLKMWQSFVLGETVSGTFLLWRWCLWIESTQGFDILQLGSNDATEDRVRLCAYGRPGAT